MGSIGGPVTTLSYSSPAAVDNVTHSHVQPPAVPVYTAPPPPPPSARARIAALHHDPRDRIVSGLAAFGRDAAMAALAGAVHPLVGVGYLAARAIKSQRVRPMALVPFALAPWAPVVGAAGALSLLAHAAHKHWSERLSRPDPRTIVDKVVDTLRHGDTFADLARMELTGDQRARESLEDEARPHGRVEPIGVWENWAGTQSCVPCARYYPRTREELIEIVREAKRAGRRVRVVGAGHSWPALSPTTDVLVFIAGLNAVSVDTSDPQRPSRAADRARVCSIHHSRTRCT